jgi:hypothetical protein
MPLYMEFLETFKNSLFFFTFIFKKNFTYEVIENIDKILSAQIRVLKNIPQHGLAIRREMLHMIKYLITEINQVEK